MDIPTIEYVDRGYMTEEERQDKLHQHAMKADYDLQMIATARTDMGSKQRRETHKRALTHTHTHTERERETS